MRAGATGSSRILILSAISVAILITCGVLAIRYTRSTISVQGSIVRQSTDTRKESPIADVKITAVYDATQINTTSDFSGYFRVNLQRGIHRGDMITLHFQHPDYNPVELTESIGDHLNVIRMVSTHPEVTDEPHPQIPKTPVANIFVRYTTETTTAEDIGTGIKTFQIQNTGNVSCANQPPCSPDGKWKASVGWASLDAGAGNTYENARLSCIAGPCPFTKIQSDNFSRGGQKIAVTILNWSDTTTFLLQAEVYRDQINDLVRETYPVIFGDALNFTLPPSAEGPSLEAEISGENIVFPLGPSPKMSWADCDVQVGKDQSKNYRCELKEGYQFR